MQLLCKIKLLSGGLWKKLRLPSSPFFRALCRGIPCFSVDAFFMEKIAKQNSLFFGFFQKSQNMSHGNGSSAFVFEVMGILKPVTVSTDKGLQFSHSPMVGCHSLFGSNFYFRMTYFDFFSDFFKRAKKCLMEMALAPSFLKL